MEWQIKRLADNVVVASADHSDSLAYRFVDVGTHEVRLIVTDDDIPVKQKDTLTRQFNVADVISHYYLKDHLGNVRVTVEKDAQSFSPAVMDHSLTTRISPRNYP